MKLNYKSYGAGDPIIILHGLFGTLDNWQTIARHLSKDYLVYLVDQRNHGRSPHADEFNYPIMAEDLRQFMEDQWIHRAYIIGHSMGGKTAMQFALTYPDMVEKLIVVDIAPKAYEGGHQEIFKALFEIDLTTIENRKAAEDVLAKRITDKGVNQFLLKNLTRNKTDGQFMWKMNLPAIFKGYEAILAAIVSNEIYEKPALFIRGGDSNYIQLEDETIIKRLFPAASIQTIDGAGHWVHAVAPTELLKCVNTFLSA